MTLVGLFLVIGYFLCRSLVAFEEARLLPSALYFAAAVAVLFFGAHLEQQGVL